MISGAQSLMIDTIVMDRMILDWTVKIAKLARSLHQVKENPRELNELEFNVVSFQFNNTFFITGILFYIFLRNP